MYKKSLILGHFLTPSIFDQKTPEFKQLFAHLSTSFLCRIRPRTHEWKNKTNPGPNGLLKSGLRGVRLKCFWGILLQILHGVPFLEQVSHIDHISINKSVIKKSKKRSNYCLNNVPIVLLTFSYRPHINVFDLLADWLIDFCSISLFNEKQYITIMITFYFLSKVPSVITF